MENTINYFSRRREFHKMVANTFPKLRELKNEDNRISFNTVLLKIFPEVKRYVQKRLKIALAKGQIDRNRYRADDFMDQLYIEAYDHLNEIKNEIELYPWLFKKVDQLLEDILVEAEFDSYFLENIDTYSKPEWNEMEETFSTDGDGDLVMIDELDDLSYNKNEYILNHVFVEDGDNEFVARLEKELDAERIRRHTDMVMYHLPTPMQIVYRLFTEHQFDMAEIAEIRNCSIKEVGMLLDSARKSLRSSFMNRYSS